MREAAARLAALIPRGRLDAAVLAWVEKASLRTVWGVGFSGGADSLALLLLLWAHWPERRKQLRVLHFNHRMRGASARADAAFCRRVAHMLGVKYVAGTWREGRTDASEAEARSARMAFFAKHARIVWLGHQQDDVAESMLMRLARGSGTGGLAAPRPVQALAQKRVHVRPLLSLKKAELESGLRSAGAEWREDETNAGAAYFRNRVRHSVIGPWIEAAGRDAVAGAARARILLEEDDEALGFWLEALAPIDARKGLKVQELAGKPRALWRRALQRWLAMNPAAGEPSRQAFETLLAAIEVGKATRQSLGRDGFAVSDGRVLRFVRRGKRGRTFEGRAN